MDLKKPCILLRNNLTNGPIKFHEGMHDINKLPKCEYNDSVLGYLYTTLEYMPKYIGLFDKISYLEILGNTYNRTDGTSFLADKINVLKIQKVEDLDVWNNVDFCTYAVQIKPSAIQYCKQTTEELYISAVGQEGNVLQFIKNPSMLVCKEAIKSNGLAIKFIDNPNKELCELAIKTYAPSIQHIKNPSVELCKLAIDNGVSLMYIRGQTLDICDYAVEKKYSNIQYVDSTLHYAYLSAKYIDWLHFGIYAGAGLLIAYQLKEKVTK